MWQFYTKQQKISGLEEQVQRKQRTGTTGTASHQHKAVVAGKVPGEGAQLVPGFFISSLCIFEARHSLCPPENEEGEGKGWGGKKEVVVEGKERRERKEEMAQQLHGEGKAGSAQVSAVMLSTPRLGLALTSSLLPFQ